MLHGEGQVLLREVEHVEDDGLRAAILAVVDGVHHLDDGLALMHGLLLAVLADDGQFALSRTSRPPVLGALGNNRAVLRRPSFARYGSVLHSSPAARDYPPVRELLYMLSTHLPRKRGWRRTPIESIYSLFVVLYIVILIVSYTLLGPSGLRAARQAPALGTHQPVRAMFRIRYNTFLIYSITNFACKITTFLANNY